MKPVGHYACMACVFPVSTCPRLATPLLRPVLERKFLGIFFFPFPGSFPRLIRAGNLPVRFALGQNRYGKIRIFFSDKQVFSLNFFKKYSFLFNQ